MPWGRKPIFLAGFAVLPLHDVLYTLVQTPHILVSIQSLDGTAAGIFGALFYIVVADLAGGRRALQVAIVGGARLCNSGRRLGSRNRWTHSSWHHARFI
jgi:predicted MFS family arabinose efflux permease